MNLLDRFNRLVKIANTMGIDSPEFRRAFNEFSEIFGVRSTGRKLEPRGDQTNGKKKRKKESGSFPPRKRPSDDKV